MAAVTSLQTPPMSPHASSPSSSPTKRKHSPSLSLDLSDLPQLSTIPVPSNTLIITGLNDPAIFGATNLATIKAALDSHATTYSFSPLKSFRRIIASFYNVDAAIDIRTKLDGENVLGQRIRVYFGAETKITTQEDQHLKAPSTGKLFFISPPPSPPHGWESRLEDAPNKEVHAEDLADALHRLSSVPEDEPAQHIEQAEDTKTAPVSAPPAVTRSRADSRTIVYSPVEQGHSPHLPAIAVEDTSCEPSPVEETFGMDVQKPMVHTARPPVELMEE
ncbi:Calcipressin [Aureobasidium sp. EXF-12298]|nr:Calcipressin [Aureobasidium sp. EXF-12298]KAI4753345.1 Calcipressin [Aureobasidium sp. EXF-12344]KAI4770442.1 Calcipressin [Aureobasidium sp. EXF-3400]